jgi:hypothetical protein
MRFYTQQHQTYGGLDWPARTLYVGILSQAGESVVHRHMKAHPEALLKVMAPSRDDRVIAVACVFTWALAGRLVCPRGPSLCPRPGPLHDGHPRRSGQNRPD